MPLVRTENRGSVPWEQARGRGLSHEGLVEAAGFHRAYVSQLERRVTNITADSLERLGAALGGDIVELLGA